MALAGLEGKIEEYVALKAYGLNTLEVDVKDENGKIGFVSPKMPKLAREIGAAQPYYDVQHVVRTVHAAGMYLIGRVVVMEDPTLSAARPELALLRPDGSRWVNNGGLGWMNPYDQRVWQYVVGVGKAAAKAGFDEIQFDYVRFPTDGDVSQIVYRHRVREPKGNTIARFLRYAGSQLHPLGVRVSADVFGLAATHDLGIGQVPKKVAPYVDALYPMVYPSHFCPGEYGIPDPDAYPGRTVARALLDFRRQLKGKGDADPVAAGLLARAPVRADRGHRPDRGRPAAARRRVPALEPGGGVHPGGAVRLVRGGDRRRASAAARRHRARRARGLVRAHRRAGRRGDWAIVVRADEKLLAVKRVQGGSFDFVVSLPRRDATVRVSLYGADGKRRLTRPSAHVFGLPRSAEPAAVLRDRRTARSSARSACSRARSRARAASYVEDLVTGRGAVVERAGALSGGVDAEGRDRGRGAARPTPGSRSPGRTSTRCSGGC